MRYWVAGICVALVIVFAGCSIVTKPTETVTVERQDLVNAYARAKILYWRAVEIASRACATGQWPPEACRQAQTLHEQAKQLASEIDAKIAVPESEIDWKRIMKLFEIALGILL